MTKIQDNKKPSLEKLKIMDDKKTIKILISLLRKYSLTAEEKEAVSSAIGILSWTVLSKSRVKSLKARKKQSVRW